jgi:hypothetical protein
MFRLTVKKRAKRKRKRIKNDTELPSKAIWKKKKKKEKEQGG